MPSPFCLPVYSYTYDANGNVSEVLDASGGIAAHYEYDAFGNTVTASGTYVTTNVYRFSTKPVDEANGLYYYGRRYYNPEIGRWVNHDPSEEQGGENLYAFVGNDPVLFFDRLGLDRFEFLAPWNSSKCKRLRAFRDAIRKIDEEMIQSFDGYSNMINYVRNVGYAQIGLGFVVGSVSVINSILIAPTRAAAVEAASFAPGTEVYNTVYNVERTSAFKVNALKEVASNGVGVVVGNYLLYSNTTGWVDLLLRRIDALSQEHAEALREYQGIQRDAQVSLQSHCCSNGN